MKNDPIVQEIRKTRQKIFEDCKSDLNKYLDWMKEFEDQDQDRLVSHKTLHNNKHQETAI
ncbi:hypothetical protein ES705_43628 [subsurface metagenome]